MRGLILTVLCLGLALAGVRAGETDEFKEMRVIKGMWTARADGQKSGLAPNGGTTVSIELIADGTAKINGAENLADVRLHPSKEPKTLEIEYVEGPLKGKKQFGIYEFKPGKTEDADTWTIVISDVDAKESDRPMDITGAKGKAARYVFGRYNSNVKVIE
jgi:uncharacterized protein (TIGR03067 family)